MMEDRLKAIRIGAGGLSAGVVRFGATLTALALQGPEGPVNVVPGHRLRIAADAFTPVDADNIPPAKSMRYRQAASASGNCGRFAARASLMKATTTISRSQSGPAAPAFAARLQPARSGIAMDVWTTEPGLKFYDGGGLLVRAASLGCAVGRSPSTAFRSAEAGFSIFSMTVHRMPPQSCGEWMLLWLS